MTEQNDPTEHTEIDAEHDTDEVQGFGPVPYPDLGGGGGSMKVPLADPIGLAPSTGGGGTAKKIVGTTTGKPKFLSGSNNVMAEGKGVIPDLNPGPVNNG